MNTSKILVRTLAVVLTHCLILNSLSLDPQPKTEGVSHLAAPSAFDKPLAQEVSSRGFLSKAASKVSSLIPSIEFSQGALLVTTLVAAGATTSAYESSKIWLLGALGIVEAGLGIQAWLARKNQKLTSLSDDEEEIQPSRIERGFVSLVWATLATLFFPIVMDFISLGMFEHFFYWGIAWAITMLVLRRLYLFSSKILGSIKIIDSHNAKRLSWIAAIVVTGVLTAFTLQELSISTPSLQDKVLNLMGWQGKASELQNEWRDYVGITEKSDGSWHFVTQEPFRSLTEYPHKFKSWSVSEKLQLLSSEQRTAQTEEYLDRGFKYGMLGVAFTYLNRVRDPKFIAPLLRYADASEFDVQPSDLGVYVGALGNHYSVASPEEKKKILRVLVEFHGQERRRNMPVIFFAADGLGIEGITHLMLELKEDDEAVMDLLDWIRNEQEEDFPKAQKLLIDLRGKLGKDKRDEIKKYLNNTILKLGAEEVARQETLRKYPIPTFWDHFRETPLLWFAALFQSLIAARVIAAAKRKFSRRQPPRNKNVKTPEEMAAVVQEGMSKYGREKLGRELSDRHSDNQADSYDIGLRLADGNEPLFMDDDWRCLFREAQTDPNARRRFLNRAQQGVVDERNVPTYITWYLDYYHQYRTDKESRQGEDIYDLSPSVTPEQIHSYIVANLRRPDLTHLQLEFLFGEMIRRLKMRDSNQDFSSDSPFYQDTVYELLRDWQTIPALRVETPPSPPRNAIGNILSRFISTWSTPALDPDSDEKFRRLEMLLRLHLGILISEDFVISDDRRNNLYLRGINFTEELSACLVGPRADAREASFEYLHVAGMNLEEADIREGNFRNSKIAGTKMNRADLRWADFTDARFGFGNSLSDLMQQLQNAGLADAGHMQRSREADEESNRNDLRGADLRWAKFNSKVTNVIVGADLQTGRKTRILRKDKDAYFSDYPDELFQIDEDIPSPISAEEAVAVAL